MSASVLYRNNDNVTTERRVGGTYQARYPLLDLSFLSLPCGGEAEDIPPVDSELWVCVAGHPKVRLFPLPLLIGTSRIESRLQGGAGFFSLIWRNEYSAGLLDVLLGGC